MIARILLLSLAPLTSIAGAELEFPREDWIDLKPAEAQLDAGELDKAKGYAQSSGGSGLVIHRGKRIFAWGDQKRRYDLKSTSKSIGVTALGVAIGDGKLALADRAIDRHPGFAADPKSNRDKGWHEKVTLFHLATQTAGFEKPGGFRKFIHEPGTAWHYSDGGPNWLAECVTLAYERDVEELLFERVFTPIGIERDDLRWRNNSYRPHQIEGVARREFGSGVHANVDAMARIGLLYLRDGKWRDRQLIPADFVKAATRTPPEIAKLPTEDKNHGKASHHYGLLWWNNNDGTLPGVPREAYWSWGLYDSLIFVVPSHDLVVARTGKSWKRKDGAGHYDVLAPFFQPLISAMPRRGHRGDAGAKGGEATPKKISGIRWAPSDQIVRLAKGSDNWPAAWADDGAIYTAYGDGNGFTPKTKQKLSLGLARVTGNPPDVVGENLRTPTLEQLGDGAKGKKASGMISVGGTLVLLARNADNAQLAWSSDHGATWTWADWRFETSFGYPTFFQRGQNDTLARDSYVYIASHDSDSAYKPADYMVLARVPAERILQRSAYQFYAGKKRGGEEVWSKDVGDRVGMINDKGRCYRSGISYNAPLGLYFWVYTHERDSRFKGGFTVRTAPKPTGPWQVVFTTEKWDVGPGETASFPPKWIAADGRSGWMLFSGDDCFSLRRAEFVIE